MGTQVTQASDNTGPGLPPPPPASSVEALLFPDTEQLTCRQVPSFHFTSLLGQDGDRKCIYTTEERNVTPTIFFAL